MFNNTKAGSLLGAVGFVGGAWYAFNKGQSLQKVAITAVIIGVGGMLVGNAFTKLYE